MGSTTYRGLKPGTRLLARDLRVFTLLQYDDTGDYMELQYGTCLDQRSWWRVDGKVEEDEVSDADVVGIARYCRDCMFFLQPEWSPSHDAVLITRHCPNSPHKLSSGGGYAVGGQLACSSFRQVVQLSLTF